jgi:hypothetical protein
VKSEEQSKRPFLTHFFAVRTRSVLTEKSSGGERDVVSSRRYGEAFWRAHHEARLQSELNQREYCEAYEVPLKAFGNWRAKFKAEPQTPARKVLYRRGGLSHTLSHGLSHGLSHDLPIGPIIPPAREGRRRMFSESDKQQILEEAMRPHARLSEVARRYGQRNVFCSAGIRRSCPPLHRRSSRWKLLTQTRSAHHDAASCGRKCAPGLRLHRHAQGHRRACHAGPRHAAAGSLFWPPLFVPRSEGNLTKIVFWDGTGLCLFTKRLEQGRFQLPATCEMGGTVMLSSSQLSILIEGIDWC